MRYASTSRAVRRRALTALVCLPVALMLPACGQPTGDDDASLTPEPSATPGASPTPFASPEPEPSTPSPTPLGPTPPLHTSTPSDLDGDGAITEVDCNDLDPDTYPGATERCDGEDNDCDGVVDRSAALLFPDLDGDGYGSGEGAPCLDSSRTSFERGDCDDLDPETHPGAPDTPGDGRDQDCGGTDDEEPCVGFPRGPDTIQEALDQADSGDTVWVAPGIYREYLLDFHGKALTLASVAGARATVVDGEYGPEEPLLIFTSGEGPDAIVDGLGFASSPGEGARVEASSPTLIGCSFTYNEGGALYLIDALPLIRDCEFSGNSRYGSGAALYAYRSEPTLSGCRLLDHSGAIYAAASELILEACVISGNHGGDGAALYLDNASAVISGSIISRNRASASLNSGGPVFVKASHLSIQQSTLALNTGWIGGIHAKDAASTIDIDRSILAFNTDYAVYAVFGASASITRSVLYNRFGPTHNLGVLDASNLELDPGFVSLRPEEPALDDLHLLPGSPLRDDASTSEPGAYGGAFADSAYYADGDLDGMHNGWEALHGLSPLEDDAALDPDGDGLINRLELDDRGDPRQADSDDDGDPDLEEAAAGSDLSDWFSRADGLYFVSVPGDYETLEEAIDAIAWEGGVQLRRGASLEDVVVLGKGLHLAPADPDWHISPDEDIIELDVRAGRLVLSDLTLEETFCGVDLVDSSAVIERTTFVDCDLYATDSVVDLNASDLSGNRSRGIRGNRSHLRLDACAVHGNAGPAIEASDSEIRLDRCNLFDNGIEVEYAESAAHAAIWMADSSLEAFDTVIRDNWSEEAGGGIDASDSNVVLERCTISGNHAGSVTGGGGIALENSTGAITDCIFEGNTSFGGGGMHLYASSPDIDGCLFTGNHSTGYAGALLIQDASPRVTRCRMEGNTADNFGGAVYTYGAGPTFSGCTIVGNRGVGYGGGIVFAVGGAPILEGSIVAYNVPDNVSISSQSPPVVQVRWSDLYNPAGLVNHYLGSLDSSNLTVEPGFLRYADAAGTACGGGSSIACLPADLHLALGSALIDAGDPAATDVDGTRSDPGIYGGPVGDGWDVDRDGFPDWFWPGTIDDAPEGFDPMDFDSDDADPAIHP